MTEYLTEQEQVELLKNWVKQYFFVILAGVLLAVIAITGWRFWQERNLKISAHASSIYDEMLTTRAQNDSTATAVQANKLFGHYSNTTYGQMAALMLARNAVLANDYPEAQKQLNWVIDNSDVDSLRQIARIRLARLFLEGNRPEESLKTLATIDDKAFIGLIEEIKGDAYLAENDIDKARTAYQTALNALPNADVIRPLLHMKLDNLIPPTDTQPARAQ